MTTDMKVYAYSFWKDQVHRYYGTISNPTSMTDRRVFRNESDTKQLVCHSEHHVLYNKVVWTPYEDDKRVLELYLQYEQKEIAKLKEKIDGHKQNIKMLGKGVIVNG